MSVSNSEHNDTATRGSMYARWFWYWLYGVALLVVSAIAFRPEGLFESIGLFVSLPICIAWAFVFATRLERLVMLCLIAVCFLVWFAYSLLPGPSVARPAARRSQCKNNLKLLGYAIHEYHETHGHLPTEKVVFSNWQKSHCWRVQLLPYLDQLKLYESYQLEEPWNAPSNRELAIPQSYFVCPSHSDHERGTLTTYFAVVGPRTAWPEDSTCKLDDITDDPSCTALLVETHAHNRPWMEPRDLSFDEAVSFLSSDTVESPHAWRGFFWSYPGGRQVLFADGSVRFVPNSLGPEFWSALLTINDGKPQINWRDEPPKSPWPRQLKIGNCIRFAIFCVFVVLPAPWAWRKFVRPRRITPTT